MRQCLAAIAVVPLVLSACVAGDGSIAPKWVGATTSTTLRTTTSVAGATTSTTVPETTTLPTTTTSTIPIEDVKMRIAKIDDGFDSPVLVVAAPDGGPDLVVELTGRIVRADGGGHEVVLDIADDVTVGRERGLLGFAAHPDFATNALVYVNYIDLRGHTVINQYEMRQGEILTSTRKEIMRIVQPDITHNGGMIVFGPKGNLWVGMGDGGGRNNEYGLSQLTDSLLGSMLRISVGNSAEGGYEIPPDNPFASGEGGLPEVWAVGLRNPWRFTIDDGVVWIADVGQATIEEVNATDALAPGLNYGWSVMEGSECFRSESCDTEGLVMPITEYSHADGCAITGGVVYRGSELPSLAGQFFYSDFCSGYFKSLSILGDEHDWSSQVGDVRQPTGFGTGSDGEMYIVTQGGALLRLEAEK